MIKGRVHVHQSAKRKRIQVCSAVSEAHCEFHTVSVSTPAWKSTHAFSLQQVYIISWNKQKSSKYISFSFPVSCSAKVAKKKLGSVATLDANHWILFGSVDHWWIHDHPWFLLQLYCMFLSIFLLTDEKLDEETVIIRTTTTSRDSAWLPSQLRSVQSRSPFPLGRTSTEFHLAAFLAQPILVEASESSSTHAMHI
jgi:hypothetical protein